MVVFFCFCYLCSFVVVVVAVAGPLNTDHRDRNPGWREKDLTPKRFALWRGAGLCTDCETKIDVCPVFFSGDFFDFPHK